VNVSGEARPRRKYFPRPAQEHQPGVYIARFSNPPDDRYPIKIGCSGSVDLRLGPLNTKYMLRECEWIPTAGLDEAQMIEKCLHWLLGDYRNGYTEWFAEEGKVRNLVGWECDSLTEEPIDVIASVLIQAKQLARICNRIFARASSDWCAERACGRLWRFRV
jgi:hypothetical protein